MHFMTIEDVPYLVLNDNQSIGWKTEWLMQMSNLTIEQYPAFYREVVANQLTKVEWTLLESCLGEIPVAFFNYQQQLMRGEGKSCHGS